jgi:hypothetical protein
LILLKDNDIGNKNVIYSWINVPNNHKIDTLLSLLSGVIKICDTTSGYLNGKGKVKEFLHDFPHSFPNINVILIK